MNKCYYCPSYNDALDYCTQGQCIMKIITISCSITPINTETDNKSLKSDIK